MKVVACASVAGGGVMPATAATWSYNYTWTTGDHAGQPAATCAYFVPDSRPLQVPRTMVVDKAVPVGTVLYSWDFNSFLPEFRVQCTGSGIDNDDSYLDVNGTPIQGNDPVLMKLEIGGMTKSPLFSNTNPVYNTALSGIGIRFSVKGDTVPGVDGTGYMYSYTSLYPVDGGQSIYPAPLDVVYKWGAYNYPTASAFITRYTTPPPYRFLYSNIVQGFSVKADLIKTADTVQYGSLGLGSSAMPRWTTRYPNPSLPTDLLTGNAIMVVSPSCRLRTTDYTIPMGLWAADAITYVGTPAYGSQVPVNLSLECSGSVDHVRFRFEDTGTSLSGNNNISLYDTAGGNKIDGLEIELFYNGTKVNVDNTTLTDTGSHGTTKVMPESLPLYDSVSTATFQARYVQNAAVTRAGVNYTGPVTGKVNMYVTYD
ncbi:hypothetical protein RX799_04185 [Klebsiella oxytoca]|uniref:fimbrial protein n=1 Tax=Klebsiella oxytoca TaxID=571 RepID=UPI00384B646B